MLPPQLTDTQSVLSVYAMRSFSNSFVLSFIDIFAHSTSVDEVLLFGSKALLPGPPGLLGLTPWPLLRAPTTLHSLKNPSLEDELLCYQKTGTT